MAETPTQPDWLWTGFLAREAVTLLAGRPKVGKSTLVFGLLGALGTGATFSGTATSCTRVVLLTEERQTTLSDKVCGKIEHVDVLFRHDARGVPFSDIVEQTVDHAAAKGAGLVVVDTLGDWAALAGDSENSAGAILQAMRPVQEAAASGLAVLLVAHQRKAAGAHGDAVRGSNALTGAVDVVLELERPVGGVTTEANRRVLHATSRFSATPRELVLDLTDDGYTAQGTSVDASASDERERILDWLAQGGPATTEEVATGLNLPPARTAKRLNELRTDGRVQRSGDGRRGSPYTWRV